MILYPKLYLEKVTDITIEILKKYHIEALILDMDNTLLDFDKKNSRRWKTMGRAIKKEWNKNLYSF